MREHLERENMKTATPNIRLHFKQGCKQEINGLVKVSGLVPLKHIIQLIQNIGLDGNPRESELNSIVKEIIDTLETDPALYPLKTKGLLLAASTVEELDRLRFHIFFDTEWKEGVLDGGHNLLAIGHFALRQALSGSKRLIEVGRAKKWFEFKELVGRCKAELDAYLDSGDEALEILVPVELLMPHSTQSSDMDNFRDDMSDIKAARNNNASLTQATRSNDVGLFKDLADNLDESISVEWKTNDGGTQKATDLVALSWLGLRALSLRPKGDDGKALVPPAPQQLYSSKAVCMNKYDEFMRNPEISTKRGIAYELRHGGVLSAFQITGDFPAIWDSIEKLLPDSYNKAVNGRYMGLSAVASLQNKSRSGTKYYGEPLPVVSPEGFIMPLVYSMSALLDKLSDGTLAWKVDPIEFLEAHIDEIVQRFAVSMKSNDNDPQKIGKNGEVYVGLFDKVENIYNANY